MHTTATRVFVGAFLLLSALLCAPSSPRREPSVLVGATQAIQGAAAWEELERRGETASITSALEAAQYAAREVKHAPDLAAIDNPAQSLSATFAPGVASLQVGQEALRLRPIGIGYGETLHAMEHVATRKSGPRIEIERTSGVTEWWINHASGLEQGYTVQAAPAGRVDGEWLRVVLAVDGALTPAMAADGQSATFNGADGSTRLHYDHLRVYDASGRALLARMRVQNATLSLETDDTDAVYPITIDPTYSAPAYLKAPLKKSNVVFGRSMAMSGDTLVVGDVDTAYVFVRNAGQWSQQASLKPFNPDLGDIFAYSVSLSGDTLVVGAPREDGSGVGVDPANNNLATDAGAAYVFVRSGGIWTAQAYLKASNSQSGDNFGWSVGVSGDMVVVGAPYEDGSGTGVNPASDNLGPTSGAAYVFQRNGATWSQQAYVKASNSQFNDWFGWSVAASGETVVVGAPQEASSTTGVNPGTNELADYAGAAYVYVRGGATWSQQAFLKASNTSTLDRFGFSVSVSGDTIAVGAYGEAGSGTGVNPGSDDLAPAAGAAYVFARTGGTWSHQAYLKASNTDFGDYFGWAVAVSGDTVVVGAPNEFGSGTGVNPPDNDVADGAGAAYVFIRAAGTWSHRAYLKESSITEGDEFGYSVATSGDSVAAGAWLEDGSGTGVNPPSDDAYPQAGAAYAFTLARAPQLDLDGDDTGDVFAYDTSLGDWWRELSQPGGTFLESKGAWAPGWSVTPANFNTDARTDFFLFNNQGLWFKMVNDGVGFTAQASGSWWPGWQRHAIDLNGDGVTDIFLFDPVTGAWFRCVSTPTGFDYTQGAWSPAWELHVMRLNTDAFGDLFLVNRVTGRWFWALGDGAGGFTYPVSGTWNPDWMLYPGDFNGDGVSDLLLHYRPSGAYYVATTTPSGFTYVQGGWSPGWTPWVADLNGDGSDDLFLHRAATGEWAHMISNGAGIFTNVGGGRWSPVWSLYVTDFNDDGRADLFLYRPPTGEWYQAYTSVTPGTFTYSNGVWPPGLTILTGAIAR